VADTDLLDPPDALLEPGNIDLAKRPVVRNADGSISTVRSMSFGEDGREVLIPTVAADGSGILSDDAAIEQYRKTGQHLGIFATPQAATTYAENLHKQQEAAHANGSKPPPRWSEVQSAPEFKALPFEMQSKVLAHYGDTLRAHVIGQGADPGAVDAELTKFHERKMKELDPLAGLQYFAGFGGGTMFKTPAAVAAKEKTDLADVTQRREQRRVEAIAENDAPFPIQFTRGVTTGYEEAIRGLATGIMRIAGDKEAADFSAPMRPATAAEKEQAARAGHTVTTVENRPAEFPQEPHITEQVGQALGGVVPLLISGLPGAVVQAGIHGYEGEMEKSGDETRATFAALRAAPEMAAYWLIGGAAAKPFAPLLKQAGPLVKAGVGAFTSTIANVLTSAGIRATHGEPIAPDVQGITQDALFGLMHGAHSGVEAARSENGIREALGKAPTEALEIANADPEFRRTAPYDPSFIDKELATRYLKNAPDESVQIAASDAGFKQSAPDMHAAVLTELEKRGLAPADAEKVVALRSAERQAQEARDAGLDETAAALLEQADAAKQDALVVVKNYETETDGVRAEPFTPEKSQITPQAAAPIDKQSAEHVPPAETFAQTELSGAAAPQSPAEIFLRKALESLDDSHPAPVETPGGGRPAEAQPSSSELHSIAQESADSSRAWQDATFRGVGDVLQRKGVAPDSVGWTPDAAAKIRSAVLSNFSRHGQGRQELLDRSLDTVRSDLLSNAERDGDPRVARTVSGEPAAYSVGMRLRTEAGNLSAKLSREVSGEGADIARDAAVNEDGNRGQQGIPTHDEKQRLTDDLTTEIGNRFSEFVKNPPALDVAPDATPAQILRAAQLVMDGIGEERTGQTIGLAEKRGGRPSGNVQRLAADGKFRAAVQAQIFDRLSAFVRDRTDASILEKKSGHVADTNQSLTAKDKAALSIVRDLAKSGLATRVVTQLLPDHLQRRIRAVTKEDGFGGGTGEILKRIAALKSQDTLSREHKLLAKALTENGASFKIQADPTLAGSGTNGAFNPREETIRVNPFLPDAERRATILHEHSHGILVGKTEAFVRGDHHFLTPTDIKTLREIDALRQEALLHESVPEQVRQAASESNHERQMQGMRSALKEDSGNHVFYGLVNLHEFMAEALTNHEFQAFLNSLPTPKSAAGLSTAAGRNTVWGRVKQFMRRLAFSGKPVTDDSALARAFDRTIDLVKSGKLEDQLVARFGEDFDIARFDQQHKKSMQSFAESHGHGTLEEFANPELFDESASLFHSISRDQRDDASKRVSTMSRLQPLFDRVDAVRVKKLPSSDQRLGMPMEQIVRSALTDGRSSLNDLAEAVRIAGGLTDQQALAVGQAIHAHIDVAGAQRSPAGSGESAAEEQAPQTAAENAPTATPENTKEIADVYTALRNAAEKVAPRVSPEQLIRATRVVGAELAGKPVDSADVRRQGAIARLVKDPEFRKAVEALQNPDTRDLLAGPGAAHEAELQVGRVTMGAHIYDGLTQAFGEAPTREQWEHNFLKAYPELEGDTVALDRAFQNSQSAAEAFHAAGGKKPMEDVAHQIVSGDVPPKAEPTSIKNAQVNKERVERGMPELVKQGTVSDKQVWSDAARRMADNPTLGHDLIAELKDTPRSLEPWETGVVLKVKIDRGREFDDAAARYDEAVKSGDPEKIGEAKMNLAKANDALSDVEQVARDAGSLQGRSLRFRRAMAEQDYSLARMVSRLEVAKGEKLTPDEISAVEKDRTKIEQSRQQAEGAEQKADETRRINQADDAVKNLKERAAKTPKETDPVAAREKLIGAIKDRAEKGKDIRSLIQKLALSFVREGINTRNPLVDAVHDVVKDTGLSRDETRDLISGYGDVKLLDPEKAKAELRDIKGQLTQVAKLQDMAAGEAPKKTGLERRTPSDEERALIKQVNEKKKEGGFTVTDPAKQLKTALDAIKTRLTNQISDLQKQIDTRQKIAKTKAPVPSDAQTEVLRARRDELRGQFEEIFGKSEKTDEQRLAAYKIALDKRTADLQDRLDRNDLTPKTKREPVALDTDARTKKIAYERLRQEFDDRVYKEQQKQRTIGQKIGDAVVSWSRNAKLLSWHVYPKLLLATATRFVADPVGRVLGQPLRAIPGLAEKAPYELGISVRNEIKNIAGALTAGPEAWKKLTTGRSDIDIKGGKRAVDREMTSFIGNSHGMMKEPLRQGAYAHSLAAHLEQAVRDGLDPHDPIVQTAADSAAVADANRRIFMGDNLVSRYFHRQLVGSLKVAGRKGTFGAYGLANTMEFLMPIVRVSTNIGIYQTQLAVGLPEAFVRIARAASRGELKDRAATLSTDDAAAISRAFKLGMAGVILGAYAWNNPQYFGGEFEEEGRKKDAALKPGQIQTPIGALPGWLNHTPEGLFLNTVASARRVHDRYVTKHPNEKVAAATNALAFITLTPVKHMPFVDTIVRNVASNHTFSQVAGQQIRDAIIPSVETQLVGATDKVKRDPKSVIDEIEMGIPGLRQRVPEKASGGVRY
jgi:hypothetical protein